MPIRPRDSRQATETMATRSTAPDLPMTTLRSIGTIPPQAIGLTRFDRSAARAVKTWARAVLLLGGLMLSGGRAEGRRADSAPSDAPRPSSAARP